MKRCCACREEKEVDRFCKSRNRKDGLSVVCKDCQKIQRQKRVEKVGKEALSLYHKKYIDAHAERKRFLDAEYNRQNRDKIKERHAEYYKQHKDRLSRMNAQWYAEHKEAVLACVKSYRLEHKIEIAEYKKKYIQTEHARACRHAYTEKHGEELRARRYKRYRYDIHFKLAHLLRSRILCALRGGIKKSAHTMELVGCTIDELKLHLELQFKAGMTWENYGYNGWHVDHRRPCSSFDLSDPIQQRQCFNYTNLQPLWAKDNLSKGNKLDWEPKLEPERGGDNE